MHISKVIVEDVKSYSTRTEIPIERGVTAILGENGAGKSTIKEAVGFALFDSLPFANKEFIREGAASGMVAVVFDQVVQQQQYRFKVRRGVGRARYDVFRYDEARGQWISQDIERKSELLDWLTTRFGVTGKDELQGLWESCIGVPQTRFLSDFAQPPASRQETFDALLSIDDYEDSWDALRDVPKTIEADITSVRDSVVELTAAVSSLPDKRETVTECEEKLSAVTTAQATVRETLAELTDRQDELEAKQTRIEELEENCRSLTQQLETTQTQLETARERLEQATEAQRLCEQTTDEYQQYTELGDKIEELEQWEEKRDKVQQKADAVAQEIAELETKRDAIKQDVEKYNTAVETISDTKEDAEQYEALDERIQEIRDAQTTVDSLTDEVETVTTQLEAKRDKRQEEQQTISQLKQQWEEAPSPETIRSQIQEKQAKRKQLALEREKLTEEISRLKDADTDAPCPTCDQPITEAHKTQLLADRTDRLDTIQADRDTLASDLDSLQTQLESVTELKEQVATIEQREQRVDSLTTNIERLADKKDELQAEIDQKTAEIDRLPALTEQRESLADAHEAHEQAQYRKREYDDASTRLEQVQTQLEERQARHTELEEMLAEFAGLDDKLAKLRQRRSEAKSGYSTYIENKQLAETVDEKTETVTRIEEEVDQLKNTRAETATRKDELVEEFSQAELETVTEDIEQAKAKQARLAEQESQLRDSLTEHKEQLTELRSKLVERQEKLTELRRLTADKQFAHWVRENVRKAGPKMREIITEKIGTRANTLFRSIRGTTTETVEWTNDYEIVIHDADVAKSFTTLSGGEKMAAALAVRLAILEQLATVGVAFLDEPTANLDTEKKRNLVMQLKQLTTFDQLTVISHDQTFDSMTDATVSVTKPDQESDVTVN